MRRMADEVVPGENSGKLKHKRTASEMVPFCLYDGHDPSLGIRSNPVDLFMIAEYNRIKR